MKVRTRVADPASVDVTLQITMSVKDWGLVRSKFAYGATESAQVMFADAIAKAIARISAVLEEDAELPEVTQ